MRVFRVSELDLQEASLPCSAFCGGDEAGYRRRHARGGGAGGHQAPSGGKRGGRLRKLTAAIL